MANRGLIKTLVHVHKRDAQAFSHVREQARLDKNAWLSAHIQGSEFVINGVSEETEQAIAALEKQIESLKGDANAATRAILKGSIASMRKVDWQAACDLTDSILKKGSGNKVSAIPSDSVIYCPFSGDGAHYLFLHVSSDVWYVVTFNMVTRHASILASASDLKVNSEKLAITSASRARQACACFHKPVVTKDESGNVVTVDPGIAALEHALENGGWYNAGGVGSPKDLYWGKYAILLKGTTAKKVLSLVQQKALVPATFKYTEQEKSE